MSTLATTNIKHPSSASNNIVLDASGNVVLQAGSASTPALQPSGDTNTGIFFPAADTIAFAEGGVESMRIDSSSRLLVGTSTARTINGSHTGQIQLEGTGFASSTMSIIANSDDAAGSYLFFGKSRGATIGSNTIVQNGDVLGQIDFFGSDGVGDFTDGARIAVQVDGTPGSGDMPGRLVFSTTADGASSPTERMRINSAGAGLFFSSADGIRSAVSASAGTSTAIFWGRHSATSTSNGTDSIFIWSNGNVVNTNGSYTTISDAKLKENIVDAGSQWDDFKAIRICNWNFKAETGHETHRQIGPIAQELETVCPGLVFETPDRDKDGNETGEVTKGVNQSVLYMKAVKALQEAMERIEQLETEMAAVKAQLS
jgi:hypothetical protein